MTTTAKCKHCGEEIKDFGAYWGTHKRFGPPAYLCFANYQHESRYPGGHQPHLKENLFNKIYKTLKYEV